MVKINRKYHITKNGVVKRNKAPMNKALQVKKIKELLEKKGIDPDTIDVEMYVDSRLHLNENINNIENMFDISLGYNAKRGYEDFRKKSINLLEKAREIEEKRSERSKIMDWRKRNRKTFGDATLTKKEFEKWKKDPAHYDIENIDTEGTMWL